MSEQNARVYCFGPFKLDPRERTLLLRDEAVSITPKAFDTLVFLLEHAGHVVTKDVLLKSVWPNVVVEEGTLAQNVATIRKILAEGGVAKDFIETVPKHGYRFAGPVQIRLGDDAASVVRHGWHPAPSGTLQRHPERRLQPRRRPGLRGAAAILLLLGLTAGAYFLWLKIYRVADDVSSLAVVPLNDALVSAETAFLVEGLTEEVIDRLSQFPGLRVSAFASVYRYRNGAADPKQLGSDLRVGRVLTIRLTQVQDDLKVHLELVNADDGSRVWGINYSLSEPDALLAAASKIALEVAHGLGVTSTPELESRLARRHTNDPEAHRLFLHGQFYWHQFTREALARSMEFYQKALSRDPQYALAYAALADSYNVLGLFHERPANAFPQARKAALEALKIDERLAEAHISLGAYKLFYEWNWAAAESSISRAAELKPRYSDSLELFTRYGDAHHYYCYMLESSGKLEKSIGEIKRALEWDPLSPTLHAELGFSYLFARRYSESVAQFRRTLQMSPGLVFATYGLAQALAEEGNYEEAITELQKARSIAPVWSQLTAQLGYALACSGKRTEAEDMIEEIRRNAEQRYVDPINLAIVCIGLDDQKAALQWLEEAYNERSPHLIWLKVDPRFDRLRSLPEFKDLLRRIWG
jgi:DNA-binding winged helix-turn-helix (wHTH) protein/TolB-like protein